ncbi:MAG: alanine--tRNA ligase, partial [Deltaproteobacteria bacterium]|nr:alanine--tRNA ligase [Deltaproteobacteria bacterium]
FHIWHDKIGLPAERIVRLGEASNFWMMGDTGPCGPCSEIIYDQGAGTGCGLASCNIECDCDRYLEIWNIVFMQFNRDSAGKLIPLPKPNIDTGMGLERLTAVVQGRQSNYDSDIFQDIIGLISRLSGRPYKQDAEADISMRVIADHSRAVTFLIGDGVLPSNEGRGYVLRRILRRAARHGKILGLNKPFLNEVCQTVIAGMKSAYPGLVDKETYIRILVLHEEQRFMETLDGGLKILAEEVDILRRAEKNVIPGEIVFKLYDTHGFPMDLTADIVRKDGFAIDIDGFELAMAAQRTRARESWKGSGEETVAESYQFLSGQGIAAAFVGYEGVTEASARVLAILQQGQSVTELNAGDQAEIIVEQTPFYGESGGQTGDSGTISMEGGLFEVSDTRRPREDLITHLGGLKTGRLRVGDTVFLQVDVANRRAIEANHSA